MLELAKSLLFDSRTLGLGLVVIAVYLLLHSRISITYPRDNNDTKK